MKTLNSLVVFLVVATASVRAQQWLQNLDDALFYQSPNGFVRVDVSGLGDLEAYYIDQRPPGLLFGEDDFINARLSLFLDAKIGKHFYTFVQGRIDRGFDPAVVNFDARADEYFLRYTPFEEPWVNLQFGKFATVAGNFVQRHHSWQNPFITAPVPYENVLTISDQSAPPSRTAFLGRKNIPENKRTWVPLIWGPAYTSGGSVFGSVEKFDYAVEVKNASISSRPAVWDANDLGWENPTLGARLGYRPNAAWNFGVSGSGGTYLLPSAAATLPPGRGLDDFRQYTLGQDASYAWRHFQLWGELFLSRFEVPRVGNADTLAYYLEAKYKFTPSLFAALRWNQQLFGDVRNDFGRKEAWDDDLWRVDSALGYRFSRHIQAKVQYSYSHERGPVQQGEQLAAAQLTVKF